MHTFYLKNGLKFLFLGFISSFLSNVNGKTCKFFLYFYFSGLLAKVFLQNVHQNRNHNPLLLLWAVSHGNYFLSTNLHLQTTSLRLLTGAHTHYTWYITLTKTLAGFCSASGSCGYYRMLTHTFPPVVSFKRRILEFSGGWLRKQSFLCWISVTFTWLYCWCLHHPSLVWVDDLHHRADENYDTYYLVNISMSCKVVA